MAKTNTSGIAQAMDENVDGRMAVLEKAVQDITKRYGDGAVMRLGEATHLAVASIPTGALALDIALGVGGIPRGRVTEIYGPEASGKTTLCQHIVAESQRAGGVYWGSAPVNHPRCRRRRLRSANLVRLSVGGLLGEDRTSLSKLLLATDNVPKVLTQPHVLKKIASPSSLTETRFFSHGNVLRPVVRGSA